MTGAMTAFLGGLYLLYRQLSAKEGDDSAEQEAGQESKVRVHAILTDESGT